MDLPQTLPGVPAVGIDPNVEELQAITNLADSFKWLGTSDLASKALLAALGTGEPKLRDIVYIKGKDYDEMLSQIVITGGEPGTTRAPSPIEAGHYMQRRRICRLRLGLTAVEVVSSQGPPGHRWLSFGFCLPGRWPWLTR